MARAIKIFARSGSGQYIFNKNVLVNIFKNFEDEHRKIVSISTTGEMRTGKSFMLNYFLRYLKAQYVCRDVSNWLGDADESLKGFEWRASIDAVTTGIWIWSEVFSYDDPHNGGKYAIVIMDTEGLFHYEQSKFDYSAILTISSIMASTQIYNIWKDLNHSNLNHIEQFLNEGISRMQITSKALFQNLVILIKDYDTPNLAPYGFCGGEQLMDNRMQGPLGELVREFYTSTKCFLMRRHVVAEEEEEFKGKINQLEPKFVELLKNFRGNDLSTQSAGT